MKGRTEQEHPEWGRACPYQEYIIAFLDVLGFSELVSNPQNNVIFAGLFETINTGVEENGFLLKNGFDGLKTSVISDSIVMSLRSSTEKIYEKLSRLLFMINTSFAEENIFIRGAVTKGLLYHEKNIVFGPGLVRAYQLESKYAKYPRCILDEPIIKDLETSLSSDDENLSDNFMKDEDGYVFFDTYRILCKNAFNDSKHIITLRRIRDVIISNLEKYKTPNNEKDKEILQKHIWCRKVFNYNISQLKHNTDLLIK